MPYQLPFWVWPSALAVVCTLAAWRGGRQERCAAAIVALDWIGSRALYRSHSEDAQWGVMAVDAVLVLLMIWIALRSRRHWPLGAAALSLLLVVTQLAQAVDPRVSGWASQTLVLLWSYLILAAIAYGALTHRRTGGAVGTQA